MGAGGDVAGPIAQSGVQREWGDTVLPVQQALALASCSLELSLLLRKGAVSLSLPVGESH